MKVALFVCNAHDFGLTGPQKVGLTLARKLSAIGIKTLLVTNSPEIKSPTVRVLRPNLSSLIIPGKAEFLPYIRNLPLIVKEIKRFRPHAIHGHGIFFALLVAFLGKIFGIPTIQTIYDVSVTSRLPRNIKMIGLFFVDHVLCPSIFIKKYLIQSHIPVENITVLPYGIEDVWFGYSQPQRTLSTKKKVIMFWGDADFDRGVDTLLEAIPRVLEHHRDITFVFAIRKYGSGYRDKIRKFSRIYPIVLNLPHHKHISEIVSQADLVILPYNVTTMQPPLTLIESLLLGKAVITTDVEANRELIGPNDRGLLVEHKNLDQLRISITRLLLDKKKQSELSTRARHFVYETYRWDKAMRKILDLYQRLWDSQTLGKSPI